MVRGESSSGPSRRAASRSSRLYCAASASIAARVDESGSAALAAAPSPSPSAAAAGASPPSPPPSPPSGLSFTRSCGRAAIGPHSCASSAGSFSYPEGGRWVKMAARSCWWSQTGGGGGAVARGEEASSGAERQRPGSPRHHDGSRNVAMPGAGMWKTVPSAAGTRGRRCPEMFPPPPAPPPRLRLLRAAAAAAAAARGDAVVTFAAGGGLASGAPAAVPPPSASPVGWAGAGAGASAAASASSGCVGGGSSPPASGAAGVRAAPPSSSPSPPPSTVAASASSGCSARSSRERTARHLSAARASSSSSELTSSDASNLPATSSTASLICEHQQNQTVPRLSCLKLRSICHGFCRPRMGAARHRAMCAAIVSTCARRWRLTPDVLVVAIWRDLPSKVAVRCARGTLASRSGARFVRISSEQTCGDQLHRVIEFCSTPPAWMGETNFCRMPCPLSGVERTNIGSVAAVRCITLHFSPGGPPTHTATIEPGESAPCVSRSITLSKTPCCVTVTCDLRFRIGGPPSRLSLQKNHDSRRPYLYTIVSGRKMRAWACQSCS